MAYQRKTQDEWQVHGNYGLGTKKSQPKIVVLKPTNACENTAKMSQEQDSSSFASA